MKRDICIYATTKGAETIKATQSRLLGVKIAPIGDFNLLNFSHRSVIAITSWERKMNMNAWDLIGLGSSFLIYYLFL